MEFDPSIVSTESTMVRYFEEGLKPSIRDEIDQDTDDYKELVVKAVRAQAKLGLQPSFYMWKTDIHILWGSRPAHTTVHKVQTQGVIHRGEDPKASKALASTPQSEPSDKARKDKKKKQYKDRKDSKEPRNFTTPATRINAAEVRDKKRKKKKKKRDASKVTYYNCNKLGHYTDQFPEPRRPKN